MELPLFKRSYDEEEKEVHMRFFCVEFEFELRRRTWFRWKDGMLSLCDKKLQLRADSLQPLASSKFEDAHRTSGELQEGHELRVGRFTVQVGTQQGLSTATNSGAQQSTGVNLRQGKTLSSPEETQGESAGSRDTVSGMVQSGDDVPALATSRPHLSAMKKFKPPTRLGLGSPGRRLSPVQALGQVKTNAQIGLPKKSGGSRPPTDAVPASVPPAKMTHRTSGFRTPRSVNAGVSLGQRQQTPTQQPPPDGPSTTHVAEGYGKMKIRAGSDIMPAFRLDFGMNDQRESDPLQQTAAGNPASRQTSHGVGAQAGAVAGAGGKDGSSRPSASPKIDKPSVREANRRTRRAWIPDAFPDMVTYRRFFSRAAQEELQLTLDEAVVDRFRKAERRLLSEASVRVDRRDPLWRQKYFRKEGIAYYSSVSLFCSGVRKKTRNLPARSWRGLGGKWQRWTGDDHNDRGDSGGEGEEDDVNSKKLYIKILGLSESKEASSCYGKGDVWALCETGRFAQGEAMFCRSRWSGVSSLGMIFIEPLGDEVEAQRVENLAGKGGGNARSAHAIRCFNAQTDLHCLDLLRYGFVRDEDGEMPHATVASGLHPPQARTLDAVLLLQCLLSGTGLSCENSPPRLKLGEGSTTLSKAVQRPLVASASGAGAGSFPECSSSLATPGTTGEEAFDLCLTRSERDFEVLRVLETFSLNADQASLLWTCARWFRPASPASEGRKDGPVERDDGLGEGAGGSSPVVLVHGVFGAGKSLSLVALCVMLEAIILADAVKAKSTSGSPRRSSSIKILVAAGTNVAVDRVLLGLVKAGFTDIARIGSYRRVDKALLDWVVHSAPGRDAKQTAQSELQEILKASAGDTREMVAASLDAAKKDSFSNEQARRLREARVTGVTCASSTLPLLTAHDRKRTGFGLLRGPKAVETDLGRGGAGLTRRAVSRSPVGRLGCGSGGGVDGSGYDIVLLDECSQMVEPTSLLPLAVARPRRLVLVGDPMQLPPAVSHARACVASSGPPPVGPTLAEEASTSIDARRARWVEEANCRRGNEDTLEKTLFVRLARLGVTPLLLGRQYRCHPRLSGLASRLFYGGRLTDGVSVTDRQALVPGLAPLTLLDAAGRGKESATSGGSFRNDFEAQTVAEIVERLMRENEEDGQGTTRKEAPGLPASSIGIICLYKAQLAEVRRCLAAMSTPPASLGTKSPVENTSARTEGCSGSRPSNVKVSTVDAFQGAEKDVIVVASTRTEKLGFIVSPQRLCVTLTRARYHLLIVGDKKALLSSPLWREIVKDSQVVASADSLRAASVP